MCCGTVYGIGYKVLRACGLYFFWGDVAQTYEYTSANLFCAEADILIVGETK